MSKRRTIKVDYLARVEGEGGLLVKIKDDKVEDVKLNIFEPPRFFEAFLKGRMYHEAPDITARICGICPIAYMTSSSVAMESAFKVKLHPQVRALRRLIYLGEWIESHALHVYMLHAPDFLGYQDAVAMAKEHPDAVKQGLALKKLGNDIMILIGGREIHPINWRVGGFYKLPEKKELESLLERLKWGVEAAIKTAHLVAGFEFPDFEQDYELVALHHPHEYAIFEGRLISSKGLDIEISDFEKHVFEEHVPQSTSLHAYIKGRGAYMVGPMARFNLNFEQLFPAAKETANKLNCLPEVKNPFQSIIVRSIEMIHACEESISIIEQYEPPDEPYAECTPVVATAYGISEAPRGICWHRYKIDNQGLIIDARIVPPTSQNQKVMESDLLHFVRQNLGLDQERLTWLCEQVIRNYDPCISCSCHFLRLKIERL